MADSRSDALSPLLETLPSETDIEDPELRTKLGAIFQKIEEKGPVRIAVIGKRGVGKSTFVNSVRKLRPQDPRAAKVGADEVYTEEQRSAEGARYLYAGMVLQDLPGAEGSQVTEEMGDEYVKKFRLDTADACIFMYVDVISPKMLACACMLDQCHQVPVFLARNKVGTNCRSEVDDGNVQNLQEAFAAMKTRAQEQIAVQAEFRHLATDRRLFLIEAKYADAVRDPPQEGFQKDFHRLKEALQTSIRDEAKKAQAKAIFSQDAKELAAARAQLCRDSFTWYITGAGFLGAIPGVGVANFWLAKRVLNSFLHKFCLTRELIGDEPELQSLAKNLSAWLLTNLLLLGGTGNAAHGTAGAGAVTLSPWIWPAAVIACGLLSCMGMQQYCETVVRRLQPIAEKVYRSVMSQEFMVPSLAELVNGEEQGYC